MQLLILIDCMHTRVRGGEARGGGGGGGGGCSRGAGDTPSHQSFLLIVKRFTAA